MNVYIAIGIALLSIGIIILVNIVDYKKRSKMSSNEKKAYIRAGFRIPGDW